jgi:transposase-like protein
LEELKFSRHSLSNGERTTAKIVCKRCHAADYVKNGMVRGLQRYRCRQCGCNFTDTAPRGKPAAMKVLALLLYAMGNMSFSSIGRLLKVSNVSILRWVRAAALELPQPAMPAEVALVMLDEMHDFIKKRQIKYGFGERMILVSGELYSGVWVGVMMPPVNGISIKNGHIGAGPHRWQAGAKHIKSSLHRDDGRDVV